MRLQYSAFAFLLLSYTFTLALCWRPEGNDPVLPSQFLRHIKREAREIVNGLNGIPRNERFLILMVGNGALVEMFRSWMCNTQHMKDVHRRTLILMTDNQGYMRLSINHHGVRVVDCSLNDKSLEVDMSFGTEAYWRMTERRVRILGVLLRAGISFLNVEPDAVWARNPLLDHKLVSTPQDIVVAVELTDALELQFAFGFLLMRSNRRTRALYSELERSLSATIAGLQSGNSSRLGNAQKDFVYSKEISEQEVLKRLVKSNVYKATYLCLDQCSYVSGRWYINEEFRKYCNDTAGQPHVINNNWIVGNGAKKERAKLWGHWFLDADQKCKARPHHEKDEILLQTLQQLKPPASSVT